MSKEVVYVRWVHAYLVGWVKEPRSITVLTTLCYAILACLPGITTIVDPPMSIKHQLGPALTAAWGWLILVGGVTAIIGCLPGWWWVERLGLVGLTGGSFLYAFVLLELHLVGPGNWLPQLGFVCAAMVTIVIRWLRVRGAFRDPLGGATTHGVPPPEHR